MRTRQKSVDHRALAIRNGTKPKTDAEKQYATWISGKDVPLEYEIAFSTYEDFKRREKLESLLIGSCPDDVFEHALSFPTKSIDVYKALFFDTSVLHTDIDKLVFAQNYYINTVGKDVPPVDNYVLRGLNQGYQVLLLSYCNLVPTQAEALNILKRVFAGAIFKATSVQFTGMGTNIDKRAIEHCQLALKILETMDDLKSDSEDNATAYVHFVSVLKDTGSIPKDFTPEKIV
ncbi:hypothetical protein B5F76_05670 [Desulfovibrio sp. An276]|uniref:hypothetical protein n=1 Tax=Desulfovibrio sp. An276 TaxID=1965618 RepID=UPI000B391FDC|nr:hypothetical protein [Desulfovibrio sp. An276]OUO53264.1 hypothetical protein B5F76_05670 [Desulfovibrio sp. An276]